MAKKPLPEKWVVSVRYSAGAGDDYRSWIEPIFVCDNAKAAFLVARSHMKAVVRHLINKPEKNHIITRPNMDEGRLGNACDDIVAEYYSVRDNDWVQQSISEDDLRDVSELPFLRLERETHSDYMRPYVTGFTVSRVGHITDERQKFVETSGGDLS